MLKFIALGLSLLLCQIQGKTSWGSCKPFNVVANFDASQYVGKWYEIYRDKDLPFEKDDTCVTATYGAISSNQISVLNYAVGSNGKAKSIDGRATCQGAQCKVKFDWYIPKGSYNVVDTDYTNYAIVYSCTNFFFGLFKVQYAWILGRSQTLATETTQIASLGSIAPSYSTDNLMKTTQGGSCFY
ncbi:apolipoprotein d [Stylonychia lemnae]|uniref:Apolipoprotein D n=1 Tax=Stylonychia lemnae TaxID=5949 RepID=A0A078A7M5_STYLE|nr:apolipoprotein d [Stylonychia lemnae]|eukprot:CDW76786.1 apolipoprotein d [Stylonychia lemnae]